MQTAILTALDAFLNPLTGGPAGPRLAVRAQRLQCRNPAVDRQRPRRRLHNFHDHDSRFRHARNAAISRSVPTIPGSVRGASDSGGCIMNTPRDLIARSSGAHHMARRADADLPRSARRSALRREPPSFAYPVPAQHLGSCGGTGRWQGGPALTGCCAGLRAGYRGSRIVVAENLGRSGSRERPGKHDDVPGDLAAATNRQAVRRRPISPPSAPACSYAAAAGTRRADMENRDRGADGARRPSRPRSGS